MKLQLEQLESRDLPSGFVKTVWTETPALASAQNDFAKVNLIREWAYKQIDLGTDAFVVDSNWFYSLAPGQMLDFFRQNQGVVSCGGAAVFLQKTYQAMGFSATTLNGGYPAYNSASHVVTLVQIVSMGNIVTSVQDSLGNSTYTNQSGSPLDITQIRNYLASGQSGQIYDLRGAPSFRDYYVTTAIKDYYVDSNQHDWAWQGQAFSQVGPNKWKFACDADGNDLDALWLAPKGAPVAPRTINLFSTVLNAPLMQPRTDVFGLQTANGLVYFGNGVYEPFPGLLSGISVAQGDLDGDGIADLVVGAGPGGGPHVKAYNGQTGAEMLSFFAFESAYTHGVFVGIGDYNGDGKADISCRPRIGSNRVRVMSGIGSELASYFE